jgi:ribosomal protein S24E
MKLEIKNHTKNPLLYREEFTLEIVSENNPQKGEILEFLKKNPEACVIKEIRGNFGRNVFRVIVFAYDTPEAKEKTEYLPRKLKKKLEEEKKKAEETKGQDKAKPEEAKV